MVLYRLFEGLDGFVFFFYLLNSISRTSGLLQCLILLIKGLYKDTTKNEMSLGVCSRTGDIVEPMIKPQWFVNCNTMAKASLDAVRSKKIEIVPQQYEQDWYRYIYYFLYLLVVVDLCHPFNVQP
jgi:hypothetical protein